jgi:hypothetical protein
MVKYCVLLVCPVFILTRVEDTELSKTLPLGSLYSYSGDKKNPWENTMKYACSVE